MPNDDSCANYPFKISGKEIITCLSIYCNGLPTDQKPRWWCYSMLLL